MNDRDREFARRTVELWYMEDNQFFREVGRDNLRDIQSLSLNKKYGLRSRFYATHHLNNPGYEPESFNVAIRSEGIW